MESLTGKVAIVTGGTRGIGRAIVERLLHEGTAVAFCGRTRESVDAAAQEFAGRPGKFCGHAADITDPAQVRNLFEAVDRTFGGLDILVNNAGAGVFRKVGEMSVEDWRRNIDLNLNAAFYCSREALDRFRMRGGGFIVNISSLAGKNPFSGGAGYNASKFGLNGFSEALLLDHRNDNVRVSYVMPGSVDTGFSGGPANRSGDRSWMITPEDVAEVVAMVLRMPARTMVSRVEMRPSRPPK
ncbi:MAG TPA: SDR family oxidoreductase [Bryobacteraceae bacterium]|jgi:NAD(P)-dependent dehydrogenase (short-subunit alcohol dehydrogenase family)